MSAPLRFDTSRLRRWASGGAAALVALSLAGAPRAGAMKAPLVVFADMDDDDADAVPDAEQAEVGAAARAGLPLAPGVPSRERWIEGAAARLLVAGRAAKAAPAAARDVRLQGVSVGKAWLRAPGGMEVEIHVVEVFVLGADGARLDLARSRAAVGRSLPRELTSPGVEPEPDGEELRWGVAGSPIALPSSLQLVSRSAGGAEVDSLAVPLVRGDCPQGTPAGMECRVSGPIRGSLDDLERRHPALEARALLLRVGGRVAVRVGAHEVQSLRVGAPRGFPADRYRVRTRVRLVRAGVGAGPPVGVDDADALRLARAELEVADRVWGQCGIALSGAEPLDLAVVDPPPPHLVAVGCESGLPASGGRITLRVRDARVQLDTRPGASPTEVAVELSRAITAAGARARVSRNAATGGGAMLTADVLVTDERGAPLAVSFDEDAPLATDRTLGVCLGRVDLADGLTHFADHDSAAGTLEERTLLKAVMDDDPATIDLVVVPAFVRTGRIGESFIHTDGGSLANAIVLDRAGLRVGARSNVLAHELGHVLLDLPGHPDDFGPDTTGSLMDADAADGTVFGPRRLSLAECRRALVESGPGAITPLVVPWPFIAPGGKRSRHG